MKTTLSASLLTLSFILSYSQSILNPGAIVFASVNADDKKPFEFVILSDIDSGTVLHFTDDAWIEDSSAFRGSEGTIHFTAYRDYIPGEVVSYSADDTDSAFEKSGSYSPSATGDNIIVYQISDKDTSFIYGIGWAATLAGNWEYDDTHTTRGSDIPPGLSVEKGTITYLGNKDNYVLDTEQIYLIDVDTVLSRFANPLNYIMNDTVVHLLNDFSIFQLIKPEVSVANICEYENFVLVSDYEDIVLYSDESLTTNFTDVETGAYTIWVRRENGAIVSDTTIVSFSVYPQPDSPVISEDDGTLSIAETGYTTYWYMGETLLSSGKNYYEYSEEGTYSVINETENGCRSDTAYYTIISSSIDETTIVKNTEYSIYTLDGKKTDDNLPELAPGMYVQQMGDGTSRIISILP